jgi:3-deoxy-D-manno-octulosonic-acid transferase
MRERPRVWPHVAYNTAITVASPFLLGYLAWRLARGKSREGWSERWGSMPETLRKKERRRIWCHAASVGEVMAATTILRELRKTVCDADIVVTTITPGGHEVAEGLVGKTANAVGYLPFDIAPLVRRAVDHIQPDLFIGVETEIWPNLLYALRSRGVACALVNARISDRSYPRYKAARWLIGSALECYDAVMAQSQRDRERLLALGTPPDHLSVEGNVKFDEAVDLVAEDEVFALKETFHIPPEAPVWVVGSTRVEEEERMVIAAHRLARASLPNLVLIHAPRHIERAEEVAAAVRAAGIRVVRRTQLAEHEGSAEAIILDTFGELARVYALGDVAFVGNSLVRPGGGQNPIQPLAQGKPVLLGPFVSNFRDVVAEALDAGVAFTVSSPRELAGRLVTLIRDQAERDRIAERALDLIRTNRGASTRYASKLMNLLDSKSSLRQSC